MSNASCGNWIQNIVILDCYADHSGENTPSPTYGFGYLVNGNTVFYGNTAGTHNYAPDVYNEGSYYNYSPCVNLTQDNTVTRINQGNCTGVSIYNGSNYEVILYSTDGNPVSQTISVGGNKSPSFVPILFHSNLLVTITYMEPIGSNRVLKKSLKIADLACRLW